MKNLINLFLLLALSCQFAFTQNAATDQEVYVCPPCNSNCDELEFAEAGTCNHCGMTLVLQSELPPQPERQKIAFYLQSGVEVLDFAGPMEVFAYAGYEVFTVSRTKEPIVSQGILTIVPDYSIEDAPQADILAFFGGNSSAASKVPEVIEWVKSQNEVSYHFSVCTGAFILAEAGILDGLHATTFHSALDNLENNYPNIEVERHARFVDNGNVITTAGISAGIDGALHLVAKLKDFNTARSVAYYMEYDKWVAGEGLILADDNPYVSLPNHSILQDYEGAYEFLNGQTVYIKFNERERSLYAEIEGTAFPLFYTEKDQFITINDNVVTFKRNGDNKVAAYSSSDNPDVYFKRLKP